MSTTLFKELGPDTVKPKPIKKMWRWIIKRGNARPETTFEYYVSEADLMEDLNPLDVVIIQRADWTEIEVEQ